MIKVILRRPGDETKSFAGTWELGGPRQVYEYPTGDGTRFEAGWLVVHRVTEEKEKRNLFNEPGHDDLAAFPIEVVEAVEYHNHDGAKPKKKEK